MRRHDQDRSPLHVRLSWVALVAALIALVMVAIADARGGATPWTSWAIPLFIMLNVAPTFLRPSRPRLTTALSLVSAAVAVVAIVSLVASIVRA